MLACYCIRTQLYTGVSRKLSVYLVKFLAGWLLFRLVFDYAPPPLYLRIIKSSVNVVRHSRGSYIVLPLLSLEVVIPEIKLTRWRCHPLASPPHKRFLIGCSSPFMRLAEHLTAPRAWCKQCLPGR